MSAGASTTSQLLDTPGEGKAEVIEKVCKMVDEDHPLGLAFARIGLMSAPSTEVEQAVFEQLGEERQNKLRRAGYKTVAEREEECPGGDVETQQREETIQLDGQLGNMLAKELAGKFPNGGSGEIDLNDTILGQKLRELVGGDTEGMTIQARVIELDPNKPIDEQIRAGLQGDDEKKPDGSPFRELDHKYLSNQPEDERATLTDAASAFMRQLDKQLNEFAKSLGMDVEELNRDMPPIPDDIGELPSFLEGLAKQLGIPLPTPASTPEEVAEFVNSGNCDDAEKCRIEITEEEADQIRAYDNYLPGLRRKLAGSVTTSLKTAPGLPVDTVCRQAEALSRFGALQCKYFLNLALRYQEGCSELQPHWEVLDTVRLANMGEPATPPAVLGTGTDPLCAVVDAEERLAEMYEDGDVELNSDYNL